MIGGFVFVSYPAVNGNSGVMTFMINQDALLLQKDLGKTTTGTQPQRPSSIPISGGAQWSNDLFPSSALAAQTLHGCRLSKRRTKLFSSLGVTLPQSSSTCRCETMDKEA